MIAVIFEVVPRQGHRQAYLDIAAGLRPLLDRIDGFLSIERFQSLSDPNKILSLSFFRDEAALALLLNVTSAIGKGAKNLEPAIDQIERIIKAFAKGSDENQQELLMKPELRKQLPRPAQTDAFNPQRDALDDKDAPF